MDGAPVSANGLTSNASATSESIAGRATGVLFFTGFGALWLFVGLGTMHRLNVASGAVVLMVLAVLVIPSVLVLKQASKLPKCEPDPERGKLVNRTFKRVNVAQWIAIPVAIVVLNIVQRPEYIVPTIAAIVGIHLLPLARAFDYHMHYWTGGLLVVWSVGTVVLVPAARIASVAALGTAFILLLSASYTLVYAVGAVKRALESAA